MKFQRKNLIIGALILLAFFGAGALGLFQFSHSGMTMEAPMVNCPYSQNGFSVCVNELDHIGSWQKFLNVVFPSIAFISILFLGIVLHLLNKRNILLQEAYTERFRYDLYKEKVKSRPDNISRWLSLLENSPSLTV